jgi:alcohol dehydrogenase
LSGEQFTEEMLPYIEVPTTCRNPTMFTDRAILVDARDRSVKKVILHSYPKAVLIDPGLSTTLSAKYTLTTMVDAFLNAFEGYISKRGNFFSEMLFSQAFGYIVPFLRQAHEEPGNIDIRMKAAQGGLLTGLGLHMSYPGLGHALSQVISGRFRVPQAAIATVLLPHILERSVTFCPLKMAAAAESIGEETRSGEVSSANYLVEYSRHLIASLRLPLRLSDFELSIENLISIVDTVQGFEGIGYLPEQVTTDDIINLLRQAY